MKKEKQFNDEWQQPIPFDTIKRPEFPVDCLPVTVRNYVLAVAEATQTPVDMAGVAALAVMAVCVQGKYEIEGKIDWHEPLNLYGIIVASPAERKSAIITLMTRFINEYEIEWNKKHQLEIERNKVKKKCLEKEVEKLKELYVKSGNGNDMKELLKKQDELTNFKELHNLRLLADDTTPEALITLMANNNGKISVISSEGGIFEILQGRYTQSVNIDAFLKAHNGDTIKTDRTIRGHESIEKPCLTVLLSIQPQVLEGLMSNNIFRGRGLTDRFLYSIPTTKMGSRKHETQPIPIKYIEAYKKLCYDLLDIPCNDTPKVLKLSKEATKLSAVFANRLEPRLIKDLENIAGFAGKLHGAIIRIAGILHLIGGHADNQLISYDTLRNAISIGRYFLKHAKMAYQLMGADKQLQDAKYILRQLEKQEVMEITRYEVFRLCRGRFKKDEDMTSAFELLNEYGYIKEVETEYKGAGRKPSKKYNINPNLWIK